MSTSWTVAAVLTVVLAAVGIPAASAAISDHQDRQRQADVADIAGDYYDGMVP
jgi:hypothetical protein